MPTNEPISALELTKEYLQTALFVCSASPFGIQPSALDNDKVGWLNNFRQHEFYGKLDKELMDCWHRFGNESKLQDRYSKRLVNLLLENLIPSFELSEKAKIGVHNARGIDYHFDESGNLNSVTEKVLPDEQALHIKTLYDKVYLISATLRGCIKIIVKRLTEFAPELYKENGEKLSGYLGEPEEEPKSLPTSTDQEPKTTEPGMIDLNVKILLAYQSGILNGTFHTLPPEKQYSVLSLLFGKTKGNVKNALTALYGNANTDRNPKNLPSIVEKTNNLITEKDLGIPLVIGRKKQ
ncbi:hypothetical protein [Spirosoma fluviale]|uniref:Uncharacterized protein n=1 Tax=Spirosoma fluviale TaxID=1597977 RepID=A0A286GLJ0_9BACT|nr:hypothetical protein [Spirosoma fluviale]SOD96407.1 hypothetical protein SAMN06269250_5293 [Spirosoma fluviale]